MPRHSLTTANVREVLPPLQGLFGLLFFNPGRCPGLSSVGLSALRNAREFVSFVSNRGGLFVFRHGQAIACAWICHSMLFNVERFQREDSLEWLRLLFP